MAVWSPSYANLLICLFPDQAGIISSSVAEEGQRRAKLKHDGLQLGMNFLAMLGLEPRKTDVEGDLA